MRAPLFTSFEEKVHPAHSAVIVVDVQNDFCHDEGWMGKKGRKVPLRDVQAMVPRLSRFIDAARDRRTPILWVRGAYDEVFLAANQRERIQRRGYGSASCLSGTWGQDFYILRPKEGEVVVTKHRADAIEGTNLDGVLKSNGIHTLLITGVTTE